MSIGTLALLTCACLVLALFAFVLADKPVEHTEVERFAARHAFAITEENGAQVLGYLRTIRRWRYACVVFAAAFSLGIGISQQKILINFAALLAGLFAAVLLTEIRMAGLTSARRAAFLAPRRFQDYLHPAGRQALVGTTTVTTVLSLLVLANRPAWSEAWFMLATGPGVAITTWLVAQRVLRRAQPIAEPDRLVADNAIRTQSLQTLAAGGSALAAYAVLAQLAFIFALIDLEAAGLLLIPIGLFVVPWSAWRIATRQAEPMVS